MLSLMSFSLGESLGLDQQKLLGKRASKNEAAIAKQERKAKEAEQNRRRSRGEIIRYPSRGR